MTSKESLWQNYRDYDRPLHQHAADNIYEVMMQDVPGSNVPPPGLVRQDGDLADALLAITEEFLTEREQFILNASIFERLGVRAIGDQLSLSKSQVHRLLQGALAKLRVQLVDSPAVSLWLERVGANERLPSTDPPIEEEPE